MSHIPTISWAAVVVLTGLASCTKQGGEDLSPAQAGAQLPIVASVSFQGSTIPAEILSCQIRIQPGEVFDLRKLQEDGERLRALYLGYGRYEGTIQANAQYADAGVEIIFEIDEGPYKGSSSHHVQRQQAV